MMQEMIKKVILIIDDSVDKKTQGLMNENNQLITNKVKNFKTELNTNIKELK